MASTSKNKYPADKAGTPYSGFKNTKRTPPGKTRVERVAKESGEGSEKTAADKNKTA